MGGGTWRGAGLALAALLMAAGAATPPGRPAAAQGLSIPGLGGGAGGGGLPAMPGLSQGLPPGPGGQPETPEQRRAFCGRVAQAAAQCGLALDVAALSACLLRTLPAQDSLRVAQLAHAARGNAGAILQECGIGFGR